MTDPNLDNLRRVETEHGSRIEPPLEEDWPPIVKLRWAAAAATHDTGMPFKVHEMPDGLFSVQVGFSSHSGTSFHRAWDYIQSAAVGAEQYAVHYATQEDTNP